MYFFLNKQSVEPFVCLINASWPTRFFAYLNLIIKKIIGATIRIGWESQCRPSKFPKFLGPQNNSLLESLGQWYILYYEMASGLSHYVRRPAVPSILYGQTETATYFKLTALSLSCSTRGQNIVTVWRRRRRKTSVLSIWLFFIWNVII